MQKQFQGEDILGNDYLGSENFRVTDDKDLYLSHNFDKLKTAILPNTEYAVSDSIGGRWNFVKDWR